jgi:16S rRNA (adenine1518-N6/adenine1519-N6)-dimethyltransferase
MHADWPALVGRDPTTLVANLPYNVSVPLLGQLLERVDPLERFVVMVQREVADRLVTSPGDEAYGPVSVRVAFHADAEIVRRVPRDVFWPRPKVDSAVVRITRRAVPDGVDATAVFALVDHAFAERRKTVASALRRLGLDADDTARVASDAGVDAGSRPDRVGLDGYVALRRELDAMGRTA